ncbi:MAG: hypothetical protein P1Q69_03865 [Candidatus Thorarchaeota archaeon]|nr:hypothetical protein [Candidatus Thorarchaeota archaeon]
MSQTKEEQCTDVLLGIFQRDYEIELNRSERIESKASTLFNYTSAIPTVLVGLFALATL